MREVANLYSAFNAERPRKEIMSGLLAIISKETANPEACDALVGSINLSRTLQSQHVKQGNRFFAVTHLENSPLAGNRLFENDAWIVLFAGDIIDREEVPFRTIIENLENESITSFSELDGIFAIIAFHKRERRLYLVSDRRSQQPLYYHLDDTGISASTDLSTFCRMRNRPQFDERWLWEYLYFNYPTGDTTFLLHVHRAPPASVIEYSEDSRKCTIREYAAKYMKKNRLIDGSEALELASSVFANRIPKYYDGACEVACALTGGWDGRTMLALAPEKDITAYTYGVPGCHDLKGGRETARGAGFKHVSILFDEAFTNDLPHHMLETVYVSSGLQGVLRATLLYAYRELTRRGRRFPLTISGLSMDMQFRGHACAPALISHDTVRHFETGERNLRQSLWKSLIENDYRGFENHIQTRLQSLVDEYGDFRSTAHHLSYILYILSTRYFCGEIKIADQFTTVRVPCWDTRIIDLSYSIQQSTLSFSQFSSHQRGDIKELVLQAYMLDKLAPRFARIPIGNTRPDIVLRGKTIYNLYRVYHGLKKRGAGIFHRSVVPAPLEDWERWLNEMHREFVDRLIFAKDSEIRRYLRGTYLDSLKRDRDPHFIGKLATAELILRLINNGWREFW